MRHNKKDAYLKKALKIELSFDAVKKEIEILNRKVFIYYVQSLSNGRIVSEILKLLLKINMTHKDILYNKKDFYNLISERVEYYDSDKNNDLDEVVIDVLSGKMAILIDGYDDIIIVDIKQYPTRIPDESPNENTVRGSRDGFVEDIMVNTALIRRRVRDDRITFESIKTDEISKLDVVLCYFDGLADKSIITTIKDKLSSKSIKIAPTNNRAIIEILFDNKVNMLPFTKISKDQR